MCTILVHTIHIFNYSAGSSSVWDERLIWVQEAAGSSPVYPIILADMAELADAIDLGSIVTDVGVQVPLVAPDKNKTNLFGFVFLYNFIKSTINKKT